MCNNICNRSYIRNITILKNHGHKENTNMKTQYKIGSLFLVAILSLLVGYTIAQTENTFIISQGIYSSGYSYTVYKEGNVYYAKDVYGFIYSSNTNRSLLLTAIMTQIPNGGTIYLHDVTKPPYSTYTHNFNVHIIEDYLGRIREYTSYGQWFSPIATRVNEYGLVYQDSDDYSYVVRVSGDSAEDQYISMWTFEVFGYGTYQWKGKLGGIELNQSHIFGFEWHHGYATEGIIAFELKGGAQYQTKTSWGGNLETQSLTGQNWTGVYTTFKVI